MTSDLFVYLKIGMASGFLVSLDTTTILNFGVDVSNDFFDSYERS